MSGRVCSEWAALFCAAWHHLSSGLSEIRREPGGGPDADGCDPFPVDGPTGENWAGGVMSCPCLMNSSCIVRMRLAPLGAEDLLGKRMAATGGQLALPHRIRQHGRVGQVADGCGDDRLILIGYFQ